MLTPELMKNFVTDSVCRGLLVVNVQLEPACKAEEKCVDWFVGVDSRFVGTHWQRMLPSRNERSSGTHLWPLLNNPGGWQWYSADGRMAEPIQRSLHDPWWPGRTGTRLLRPRSASRTVSARLQVWRRRGEFPVDRSAIRRTHVDDRSAESCRTRRRHQVSLGWHQGMMTHLADWSPARVVAWLHRRWWPW